MTTASSSSGHGAGRGGFFDSFFSAPAPVRSLFQSFPLAIHPADALPARSPDAADDNDDDDDDDDDDDYSSLPRLYVFAHEKDATQGLPSYNPSCLKWQTILRIANVDVRLVPSSNHASPSGALPFLILPSPPAATSSAPTPAAAAAASSSSSQQQAPITSDKIARYACRRAPTANLDDPSPRIDAYQALIANSIRPAWLHALYINPLNDALLTNLYLPSSPLLRPTIRNSLRAAATAEIYAATRRSTIVGIDAAQLYADAEAAFAAFSAMLGPDDDNDSLVESTESTETKTTTKTATTRWLLGASAPGVLDADLFSYTHLLVGGQLIWPDAQLVDGLRKFGNLVRHAERLYRRCWRP